MDLINDITENPPLAPRRTRVFAALIDVIILLVGCYLIADASGQTYSGGGRIGFQLSGTPALMAWLFWFLLMPVNEGLTGQTIGKRIFKIEVVKVDYSKTTLATSIIRHLFDIVDCFFLIGLIVASSNTNKQRVGDLVAKTYVTLKP